MKTRLPRGKNSAIVTLDECEIVKACREYAEKNGFILKPHAYLRIPLKDKVDKIGRKRRIGIKIQIEYDRVK